ncbi:MAG: FAD-dependent oxidoreductase [Actinomycetota bacterium]|jgi:glycine/D-amino acid oxidase-like deaminating enzyme|nr:FAD-dependent oxidoreductase [Euzebyaceae bacterium]MDQ3451754.1 FAD-dependent oxidoreductase [Actinomycetota bacterium]
MPAMVGGGSVIVVGAGVFGAATAHELARRGWSVTLLDMAESGNTRAASTGESRLLRCGHGTDRWYTDWAWRARTLWRELGASVGEELIVDAGVAWFAHRDDGWEASSAATLEAACIPAERLDCEAARRLFPDLSTDDLSFVLYEPGAGVLRARRCVAALVRQAIAYGARYEQAKACYDGAAVHVDGRRRTADRVVWACGPWLARLFPALIELRVTKQDVLFFGASAAWRTPGVPGWVDYDMAAYGLGDLDGQGVKCNSDVEGPAFDPDTGERVISPDSERRSRGYLARRFPSLVDAPLVSGHVCQYALTADTEFIIDRHPEHEGVWLLGGGSGHGFKHGPAVAEHVADLLEGRIEPYQRFRLGTRAVAGALRTAGGGVRE